MNPLERHRVEMECRKAIAEYEDEAKAEHGFADMLRLHADTHERQAIYAEAMVRQYQEHLLDNQAKEGDNT